MQLQTDLAKISATGTQVVGVSPDSVETLKQAADTRGITFTLLSDPDAKTIKAYGLLASGKLPHPGTILIDKSGTVRAKLFRKGYRTRHANDELIAAAKAVP